MRRSTSVGARVWVVRDETAEIVFAYGYGTYLGDFPIPGWDHPRMVARAEAVIRQSDTEPPIIDPRVYYGAKVADGSMTPEQAAAEIARVDAAVAAERARPITERALELARNTFCGPKIRLDAGGGIVWGIECWWSEVTNDRQVPGDVPGRTVIQVPPPNPARRELPAAPANPRLRSARAT